MLLLLMIYIVNACPSRRLDGNISTIPGNLSSTPPVIPPRGPFNPGRTTVPQPPNLHPTNQGRPILPPNLKPPTNLLPGPNQVVTPNLKPPTNLPAVIPNPGYQSPGTPIKNPEPPTRIPKPTSTKQTCPRRPASDKLKPKIVKLKDVSFKSKERLEWLQFEICNDVLGVHCCHSKVFNDIKGYVSRTLTLSFTACKEYEITTMPDIPKIEISYKTHNMRLQLNRVEFTMTDYKTKIVCSTCPYDMEFSKSGIDLKNYCYWTMDNA